MKRGLKIENRLGLKINSRHVKRKREKENKKSNDFIVKLLGNFALRNRLCYFQSKLSTNVNLQNYEKPEPREWSHDRMI